ncbi:complement C3-like [Engraulis encrasicolus]|uniref:complement C3-like n=1 Tax=Engraulis encrasicolus TaxID=184585 RepID=UPI002FD743C5
MGEAQMMWHTGWEKHDGQLRDGHHEWLKRTDGVFWPVPGNRQFSLEATAYALLSLVRAGELNRAAPIVHWLNEQQFYGGGYGSTQANLVVYQALAEYSIQVRLKQRESSSLEVTLNNTAGHTHSAAAPLTWTFTQANTPLQRSVKVRLDRNMTVTAKGNVRGILSVMTMYYSMPRKEEEGCHHMKLDVSFQKIPQGSTSEALGMYLLTVDIMASIKDNVVSTALLNIEILTGFSVDREDLQKLAANKTWDIEELSPSQSNILIYMNEVSSVRPERFALRMHQVADVGLLQPAAVSLREHTLQDAVCLKFYHPQKIDGTLGLICHQHVCKCAAESCAVQRTEVPEGVTRNNISCIQFRDYVYKVTVGDRQLSSIVDIYYMSVTQVVKQGTDSVMEGDRRQFLSSPHCREGLGLVAGKSYLIIGSPTDLMKTQDGFHYVLSKQTWVEYWPTDSEGQTEEFKSSYSAIQDFAGELSLSGCQR